MSKFRGVPVSETLFHPGLERSENPEPQKRISHVMRQKPPKSQKPRHLAKQQRSKPEPTASLQHRCESFGHQKTDMAVLALNFAQYFCGMLEDSTNRRCIRLHAAWQEVAVQSHGAYEPHYMRRLHDMMDGGCWAGHGWSIGSLPL